MRKNLTTIKSKEENFAGLPVTVRRTANGFVEAVRVPVKLSVKKGDIFNIQGQYILSAQGINKINSWAGISIVTPPELFIDGRPRNNPYIEREENGNTIKTVYVRKIGFGRSFSGNRIALDQTLAFSPKNYLIRDLLKIKIAGVVKTISLSGYEKKEGYWYIDMGMGLGLEVDLSSEDFKKVLKTYNENVNFAERKASTIVERNIIKKMIGEYKVTPDQNGEVVIFVYSWREKDLSLEEINNVSMDLSAGKSVEFEKKEEYLEATDIDAEIISNEETEVEDSDSNKVEDIEDVKQEEIEKVEEVEKTKSKKRKSKKDSLIEMIKEQADEEYIKVKVDSLFPGKSLNDLTEKELRVVWNEIIA